MSEKGVFPEYLGDIESQALFSNVTNTNSGAVQTIDLITEGRNLKLTVTAEMEKTIVETADDLAAFQTRIVAQIAAGLPIRAPAKFVRLIIEVAS